MTEHELLIAVGLFAGGFIGIYAIFSLVEGRENGKTKESVESEEAKNNGQSESHDSRHTSSHQEREMPWFEILGVAENSAFDVVQQAYRKKIAQYHPDKIAGMAEELRHLASDRTIEINLAFDYAKKYVRGR